MSKIQLQADLGESQQEDVDNTSPHWPIPEDGYLRHTTGRERRHRDDGMASGTPGWRKHLAQDKD